MEEGAWRMMETHPRRTAGLAGHHSAIVYFLMPEGYLTSTEPQTWGPGEVRARQEPGGDPGQSAAAEKV